MSNKTLKKLLAKWQAAGVKIDAVRLYGYPRGSVFRATVANNMMRAEIVYKVTMTKEHALLNADIFFVQGGDCLIEGATLSQLWNHL